MQNPRIEERLLRRIEVFAPGGDTERLMLEAVKELSRLRHENWQLTNLAARLRDELDARRARS